MSAALLFSVLHELERFNAEDLPAPHRLTLLVLADFADDAGRAWPSVATLSKRTGLSERTIDVVLAELDSAGWLSRERRSQSSRRNLSTVYTVNIAGGPVTRSRPGRHGAAGAPSTSPHPAAGAPSPAAGTPYHGAPLAPHGAPAAPDPLREPTKIDPPNTHTGRVRVREEVVVPPSPPTQPSAGSRRKADPDLDPADDPERQRAARPYLPEGQVLCWDLWRTLVRSTAMRRIEDACRAEEPSMLGRAARWIRNCVEERRLDTPAALALAKRIVGVVEGDMASAGPTWIPLGKAGFELLCREQLAEAKARSVPSIVPKNLQLPHGFATWEALAKFLADDGNPFARDLAQQLQQMDRITLSAPQRRRLIEIYESEMKARTEPSAVRPKRIAAPSPTLQPFTRSKGQIRV